MNRYTLTARIILAGTALLALVPLARVASDYLTVGKLVGHTPTARSYDRVTWTEEDGLIKVAHVFDAGGGEAGFQEGDLFYRLDYRQYFTLEDLQRAIESIPLGSSRTYSVLRGPEMEEVQVDVRFSRYPTFLYPLTPALWQFSIWGFLVGTFFHLIGLVIAVPLVRRSRTARFSLLLIVVSGLWIIGNLIRLLLVSLAPPIHVGSTFNSVFQALTFLGLVGWIGFPAILLHKVLVDSEQLEGHGVGRFTIALYVPAVVLGFLVLVTTLAGGVGPLTLGGLIGPILFHACCYIGAAAAHALYLHVRHGMKAKEFIGGWPRIGSAIMLIFAVLFGLSVLGVAPLFGVVTDTVAGWVIVSTQLLSIVPVILVSLAALRHGKIDRVLRRALTYVTILGLIFFAFVGGMTLVEPILTKFSISWTVAAGLYVVLLLMIFERVAMRLRNYATQFFASDRQQVHQRLSRFQERMRLILDTPTLARETLDVVSEAFQMRSGHVFLRPSISSEAWINISFHPAPPYLTDRVMRMLWPHFEAEGAIWARKPELNESTLPDQYGQLLKKRNVSLAVPILGDGKVIGLLLLGPRKERYAVYTLEDLDRLRALSGQLALAIERLNLFERERALIRESTEAQLTALRAQINPHFLFNTLNTILALIEDRSREAEAAVEHLAAIFRYTLHTGGREFVPLEAEWALVGHYLSIEQARFGRHLAIETFLDDRIRTVPIPAFAVQTLVENAIKHGIEKQRRRGKLSMHARQTEDGFIEVLVADTGIGIADLFGAGERAIATADFLGIGLRNIATRLARLYDRDDLLRMASDPVWGTRVRLLIPVKHAEDSPTDLTQSDAERIDR